MYSFMNKIEEFFNTGDPIVREWFLFKSNFWPFILSGLYVLIVKVIGPSYMKNRKPYKLNSLMIFYNMFIVIAYIVSLYPIFDCIRQRGFRLLCENINIAPGRCEYSFAAAGWVIYLLKYLQFLDTIFFIMRKKFNLITNLHVIHHALLPPIGWFIARTERNGFEAILVIINCVLHIIMYSYFGLAAMGPRMRKHLWWKRYLTLAQLIQFLLMLAFEFVIKPLTGCSATNSIRWFNLFFPMLFFLLFVNFYLKTYKPQQKRAVEAASADTQKGKANGGHYIGEKKSN